MGQCSARPHKPGPPGATPGSATFTVEYANRQSGKHERLVIMQVRLLSRLLVKNDRVVQRRRRLGDNQKIDGSIPSAITEATRSVSVAAARVCGMDEDRVQFPDGPLMKTNGLACSKAATDFCKVGGRVRFPSGPLNISEGSRIRLAGPVCYTVRPLGVMRVRLPCLPLVCNTARW